MKRLSDAEIDLHYNQTFQAYDVEDVIDHHAIIQTELLMRILETVK